MKPVPGKRDRNIHTDGFCIKYISTREILHKYKGNSVENNKCVEQSCKNWISICQEKKKKTSFITPCVTTNTERFIDLYVRPRARSTLEANVFLWELCDLKLRG